MKEKKRNEILAGTVILIGILLLTAVLIFSGNYAQMFQKKREVRVFFKGSRGLEVNNPVHVNGFDVGLVKEISLQIEENPGVGEMQPRVLVIGEIPADLFIPKNSRAEIDVSLTGIKVLKIDRGSSVKELAPGDAIRGSDALNIAELSTKVGQIASSIDEFISEISSEAVVDNFKAVLVNTRNTTEKLAVMANSLESFILNNRKMGDELVVNLTQISRQVDGLLEVNSENVTATIANLPETAENLKQLTADASRLVLKNEENITRTIEELEHTSRNLKETSRKVKMQPWVLLHKPEKGDVKAHQLYTAARDLENSAVDMRNSLNTLLALSETEPKNVKVSQSEVDEILENVEQTLEDLGELSKKIEKEL